MLAGLLACTNSISVGLSPDLERDGDLDGYSPLDGDCDDESPDVSPGAPEVCNGVDDDCDGNIDDGPDGLSACTVVEVLPQVVTLDVLVVVTDAPGMAVWQDLFALAATSFLEELLAPSADVRVAVATPAGVRDDVAGTLRDVLGRTWVDQGTGLQDAADWLEVAVTAGETATGLGDDLVRRAIRDAVIEPDEADGGFARDWARLAVAVLANDDDDSLDDPSLDALVADLEARRGPGNTKVYGVVGTGDPKCSAGLGAEHLALVGRTGGLSTSICADAYDGFLGAAAQAAAQAALRDTFALSEEPVPSSVEMDVLLPEGGAPVLLSVVDGDLVWEPALNAVRVVGVPPPAGSAITLRYLAVP
jgi:hypothetical protein